MASKDSKAPAAQAAPIAANDADGESRTEQVELTLEQLAAGILSREVRPKANDIRRLAEAVLAGSKPAKAHKSDKKKKKTKAAEARKSAGKKAGDKKLAKIPGGKSKK